LASISPAAARLCGDRFGTKEGERGRTPFIVAALPFPLTCPCPFALPLACVSLFSPADDGDGVSHLAALTLPDRIELGDGGAEASVIYGEPGMGGSNALGWW
jgi:hypothetical protein